MRKWILLMVVLLVGVLPLSAQDNALPPGCNTATLSEIFTSAGGSLAEQELSVEQTVFVIDMVDTALAALRDACAPDQAAVDENAIDFSAIPQGRTEDGAFILGDPEAPITIVEFADFMCPHCQTYHQTMKEVVRNYVISGQARLEYRFVPVVDPNLSPLTARMAECADILNPGSFWHAHNVLYELAQARFNSLTPLTYAARAGLDYDSLVTCVSEQANQVETDAAVAQAAGILGTPSVMVRYNNGELVDVTPDGGPNSRSSIPYMILSAAIEAAQ